MKNYYEILGVERDASRASIKLAYRQHARELHPDVNAGSNAQATEQMAELNEAYEVLSDAVRRKQYDEQLGVASFMRRDGTAGQATQVAAESHHPPAAAKATAAPAPATSTTGATSATGTTGCRVSTGMSSSMALGFSSRVRDELAAMQEPLHWSPVDEKDFDWVLTSGDWKTRYFIAMRTFDWVDAPSLARFLKKAEATFAGKKGWLKDNVVLLLLGLQRMDQPQQTLLTCRQFGHGHNFCALVDVNHHRSLLVGQANEIDSRLKAVMSRLGIAAR